MSAYLCTFVAVGSLAALYVVRTAWGERAEVFAVALQVVLLPYFAIVTLLGILLKPIAHDVSAGAFRVLAVGASVLGFTPYVLLDRLLWRRFRRS